MLLSIHAPTRGATISVIPQFVLVFSFNPRSYKRSDHGATASVSCEESLSIHAPTRGATSCVVEKPKALELSIHAPTRGATGIYITKFQTFLSFNPRSYKRSDQEKFMRMGVKLFFQSTLLQEERPSVFQIIINCGLFQSTLLQEERPIVTFLLISHLFTFNPRSYKRSDRFQRYMQKILKHFQSTLLQEERPTQIK